MYMKKLCLAVFPSAFMAIRVSPSSEKPHAEIGNACIRAKSILRDSEKGCYRGMTFGKQDLTAHDVATGPGGPFLTLFSKAFRGRPVVGVENGNSVHGSRCW